MGMRAITMKLVEIRSPYTAPGLLQHSVHATSERVAASGSIVKQKVGSGLHRFGARLMRFKRGFRGLDVLRAD